MPPGRPKSGKTTMQDIADRLGISKVSVSKALNRKPGISEALRGKVFAAAREMGYEQMPSEQADRFAFVVSKHFFLETDAFYSEMYYHFNRMCIEKGISTALIIVGNADMEQCRLPVQLQAEEYSGVAIAGQMPDSFVRMLEKPGRPLVLMDFDSRDVSACALLTENYRWGALVTQRLLDEGHRAIGFVGQPGATTSITDRYLGYRRTLLLARLPFREDWVLVNNDNDTGLYTSDIALPRDMPTAFVCHCDMAAYYLLGTLRQNGIECPRDVSVISFDNTRLAETCRPALTSVNIDTMAFARKALELLTNPELQEANRRVFLSAALVERQSVGPGPERKRE